MNSETQFWVGTSWKMNKVLAEALVFAEGLAADDINSDRRIRRFVIPSFTVARQVKAALATTSVMVGAQNMHWADSGAWTGEVSPLMLNDCGLDMVELGHSERREHFGETNDTVGRKVAAAVRHALLPLVCIGETLVERDAGRADDVLAAQVEGALQYLDTEGMEADILFAYEPVWAIGDGGIPANSDYADQRQKHIKQKAAAILTAAPPCLYGGSVNPSNCEELISCRHIDGLFIGRSAWDVNNYIDILNRCAAII